MKTFLNLWIPWVYIGNFHQWLLNVLQSFRSSVFPSILPSVLLYVHFLVVVSLVFSKFWHGARNPYEVVRDRARFSRKFCLPSKLGKWAKRGQKRFFEFIENFLNFTINLYWIRSIMKTYIFCSVPAQIPFLRKFWFMRFGPKCSQPIRLQEFLINHISRTNQWNSLSFYLLTQIDIN